MSGPAVALDTGKPGNEAPARGALRRPRSLLIGAAALAASIAIGWLASSPRGAAGPAASAPQPPSGAVRAAAQVAHARPSAAAGRPQPAAEASAPPSYRASAASAAPSLFAPHSWHVEPPPPRPAPPAPPPPPTAPPFPYAFMGAYTPQGSATVYFLSREDRVIDAHVGDRLDGTYVFESADAAQLIFVYTPLNIRQSVPAAKP